MYPLTGNALRGERQKRRHADKKRSRNEVRRYRYNPVNALVRIAEKKRTHFKAGTGSVLRQET